MELIKTTYLTFSGKKEVIEIPSRKSSQWIIFENDIPKYYVDIYDLSIESNSMMNSLVLCGKRSIHVVLAHLNKKIILIYRFHRFQKSEFIRNLLRKRLKLN